jgi:hypothetical protein
VRVASTSKSAIHNADICRGVFPEATPPERASNPSLNRQKALRGSGKRLERSRRP